MAGLGLATRVLLLRRVVAHRSYESDLASTEDYRTPNAA